MHEDESRIILQFDNNVSLSGLAKRYPELGKLIFGNIERSCSNRGKKRFYKSNEIKNSGEEYKRKFFKKETWSIWNKN